MPRVAAQDAARGPGLPSSPDGAGEVANRFCREALSLEVRAEIAVHLDCLSVLGRVGRGNKRERREMAGV